MEALSATSAAVETVHTYTLWLECMSGWQKVYTGAATSPERIVEDAARSRRAWRIEDESGQIVAEGAALPVKYNGGVECDVTRGPCACGAWHGPEDQQQ